MHACKLGRLETQNHFKDLTRSDQSLVKTLALLASRDYQNYHGDTRENRNSRQLLFYERLIQTILDDGGGGGGASKSAARPSQIALIYSVQRVTHSLPSHD